MPNTGSHKFNDIGLKPVATLRMHDGSNVAVGQIVSPVPAQLAQRLSAQIAHMNPWKRYGFKPGALESFFAPVNPSAPRFLLGVDDDVAGMFALKLGWMFGTYLNVLAVLPVYQGRGIGSAVLTWLEMRARENGERNQFVVTSAFNTGGLKLYRRHGFQPIAEMPALINDFETEILLRKRLTPH